MNRRSQTAYFGLVATAVLVVFLTRGALSWDGSYQFFIALDQQAPYILHDQRLIVLAGQGLVLLLSPFTDNVSLLSLLFGLGYALIPLACLLSAWVVVRRQAPGLFLWASFGIGIATLPGQLPIYAEANIAVQLFWPILLALLAGINRRTLLLVVLFSVVLFFTHPYAIALFAFAAAVALLLARRQPGARGGYLGWAVAFGLAAILALARFLAMRSPYEDAQLTGTSLLPAFRSAVAGPVIVALALAFLAGMLYLALPLSATVGAEGAPRTQRTVSLARHAPALRRLALASVLLAGLVLFARTLSYRLWWGALEYRLWVLFCSLPFMLLAVLDALARDRAPAPWRGELRTRTRANLAIAAIFAVVLSANGLLWYRLTARLDAALEASATSCIPMESLDWIDKTALSHWSITPYSLVLQGRHPTKIVLPEAACTRIHAQGMPLTDWRLRPWDRGWFALDQLEQRLAGGTQHPGVAWRHTAGP